MNMRTHARTHTHKRQTFIPSLPHQRGYSIPYMDPLAQRTHKHDKQQNVAHSSGRWNTHSLLISEQHYAEACSAQPWLTWCLMNGLITNVSVRIWPLTSSLLTPHEANSRRLFSTSASQLWRHQCSVSTPCFHRLKWIVHNPLVIAVPRAVERPQLNTGQFWLPANLSNKLMSSLFFPKECYQICFPPCPGHFDSSCQAPRIILFTLA